LAPRAARRLRYIRRIEGAPDAEGRWNAFLSRLARQFDIDDDAIDRALDAIVDAPADALALLELAGAGR
jgi:hypothetical protein